MTEFTKSTVPCQGQNCPTNPTTNVLGAIPNAGAYVEFSIEPRAWTEELFTPILEAHDGKVQIPDAPGWGVTVSPAWLSAADHQVSEC